MIKSVYNNDKEILEAILTLHVKASTFELDPTFSKGMFWRGLQEPKYKSDIYPQREDVIKADCTKLSNFKDGEIKSICFDPPFLAGFTQPRKTGVMGNRFFGFRYMPEVWEFYKKSLKEFWRIMPNGGVLAFKCQDTVSSGKQFFSHVFIINEAEKLGFYTKDLFIQVAKSRIIGHNHKIQKHARKFHSYWLVFEKK